jgi:hypothetical protein
MGDHEHYTHPEDCCEGCEAFWLENKALKSQMCKQVQRIKELEDRLADIGVCQETGEPGGCCVGQGDEDG